MDIIEATRQLGQAIQQDEVYIRYAACKQQNDSDEQLQKLIGDFNLLRMTLNSEFSKEDDKDDEKIKQFNEKMRECYNSIMQNESMQQFNMAKRELDVTMKRVRGIIDLCVEGEDPETAEPSACSGSCESCGGCG